MRRTGGFLALGLLLAGGLAARGADGKSDERSATKKLETLENSLGMKMALIPAGEFMMGSPGSEQGRSVEFPKSEMLHPVRIEKAFYLGVYDVTRGQFAKFVDDAKYQTEVETNGDGSFGYDAAGDWSQQPQYTWRTPGLYGNKQTDAHPVVGVSWNDAQAFCNWLSAKEKKTYRLPTEAEWEYSCRAGTITPFYFGEKLNGEEAACHGFWPYGTSKKGPIARCTTPVGTYKPNAFGLYDMHGNVSQWCSDWCDLEYYPKSPGDDPQGPDTGTRRVLRGGSLRDPPMLLRSAYRAQELPSRGACCIGFRVVLVR